MNRYGIAEKPISIILSTKILHLARPKTTCSLLAVFVNFKIMNMSVDDASIGSCTLTMFRNLTRQSASRTYGQCVDGVSVAVKVAVIAILTTVATGDHKQRAVAMTTKLDAVT